MARRSPTARNVTAVVLATLLIASGMALTFGTGAATAVDRVVPAPNPDLAVSCGLDVVLVVDTSNSINTASAAPEVKAAMSTFLTSFEDTNTRVGIVTFNTTAHIAVPLTYDTKASNAPGGVHAAAVAAYAASGRTNWQDAMLKAQTVFSNARNVPRLVVLITDGAPNTYNSGAGTTDTPDADPAAIDPAVTAMNTVKAGGAHALVVGVGQVLTLQYAVFRDALSRVAQFPSPEVFPDTAFSAAATDLILQPDISALQSDLRGVADQVCDGSLTVTQYATTASSPAVYLSGGGGWSYTTAVTPAGDWVVPSSALPSDPSATITTTGGGTAVAQWNPGVVGWTKTTTVMPLARDKYVTHHVTCTVNGGAPTSPALIAGAFAVDVGGGKNVACSVYSTYTGPLTSRLTLAASPTLVKYGQHATLTGALTSPLSATSGAHLVLHYRASGTVTWKYLGTVTTSAAGKFARAVSPGASTQYRADFAGSATRLPATSAVRTVKVAPRISITLSRSSVGYGAVVRFSGTVAPNLKGSKVLLQRLSHGSWVTVKVTTLSSTSRYAVSWRANTHTDYTWRVYRAADTRHAAGVSAAKKLVVG